MRKKFTMTALALVTAVILAACGDNNEQANDDLITDDLIPETPEVDENEDRDDSILEEDDEDNILEGDEDESMDHSSSGDVPESLQDAKDPKYAVGTEAEITTDHMDGMQGAIGTIEGAYDTTAYTVTYTPTDHDEKVENHKWIIHEEIEDAQDEPYKAGDKVVMEADHMEGMNGAEAEIESAEVTVVYMVSYEDTNSGEAVKNHKWVTEDELTEIE